MIKLLLPILFVAVFTPLSAFALSLDQAKSQGLVGETPSGYLAAVQAGGEAEPLVVDINQKRKTEYGKIAGKNGTPVSVVEALAGKKAIELTPSGQYVQSDSGQWMRK